MRTVVFVVALVAIAFLWASGKLSERDVSALTKTPLSANSIAQDTPQGVLLGESVVVGQQTIHVFRGIPYAVPPVGTRRWKPPEAAPGWTGERLAFEFGPECIQPPLSENGFYYRPAPQMSEDCLYLNVWAPAGAEDKLPVMVWIHGGSLVEGAGSHAAYDGVALTKKGVIVVTMNYRLGVFGYFAHPELSAEQGASGNYGTMDQIQALKWIQKHIAAFGGDPENITIFGESAGALSVTHLMVSPLAKDLFHRAIAQSPYMPTIPGLKEIRFGKPSAESAGERLATYVGAESIAALRDLSAVELLQAAQESGFGDPAAEPVVDGRVFPAQVFELLEQGKQHDVPLLVGFNSGEGYHFGTLEGWSPPIPKNPESYRASIRARYGALTKEYLTVYPESDLKEAVFAPIRDGVYGWAAEKLAKTSANVKSNAYLYYFDHAPLWSERIGMGAFHASEISYVFNNLEGDHRYSPTWPKTAPRQVDLSMADIMSDYWVNFAKTGRPQATVRPVWKPYKQDQRHYMLFKDGSATPLLNLNPGAWELHEKIYSDRRSRGQSWLIDVGLLAPVLQDQGINRGD